MFAFVTHSRLITTPFFWEISLCSFPKCVEADFRSSRFALIDRGIVYAIAHVRGGGEMGRQWYEEPNGAKVCAHPKPIVI